MRLIFLLPVFLAAVRIASAEGAVERGRELFRSCQGCHNTSTNAVAIAERKQGPSLHSLFGKVTLRNGKHVDDANVRDILLDGLNGMPSFRYSFRPAEIEDLMAYLRTLKGKPTVTTADGAAYFKAYCASCHTQGSLAGKMKPESVEMLENGHAGAPALKEWLDAPARELLFAFLKSN